MLWAEKGYKHADGTPATISKMDVYITVFVNGVFFDEKLTEVQSRKFIEESISDLNGKYGEQLELDEPGSVEEELNDTSVFGMTLTDILKCNHIVMGYYYDYFDDPDKYETDLPNVPVDDFGVKPSFIGGVIPIDYLDRKSAEGFILAYIDTHYDFCDKDSIELEWSENIPDHKIKEGWEYYIDLLEGLKKVDTGEVEIKFQFAPEFLSDTFGEELIKKYIDLGMIYGEFLGETSDDILLTFNDGHTELLKNDDEFNEDHFSDPHI